MTTAFADQLVKIPPPKPGLLSIEEVGASLEALGCTPRWSSDWTLYACCPVHQDTRPSLSVTEDEGRVLAHCHRCALEQDSKTWAREFFRIIRTRTGSPGKLPKLGTPGGKPKRYADVHPVCAFIYLNPDGSPLARLYRSELVDRSTGEVERHITWQRPRPWLIGDGCSWDYGLPDGGMDALPLWLEGQVRARIATGGAVMYLTEGESDAHAAGVLGHVPATCSPGGAGKFRPKHAQALAGAEQVIVVADHDPAGLKDAAQRAAMVAEVLGADRVRLVRSPVSGEDLRDLLERGGTVEDLEDWVPESPAVDTGSSDTAPVDTGTAPSALSLSRFISGGAFILDVPDEVPTIWGKGSEVLWARGEALMLAGVSGVGKTTISGQLVRSRLGLSSEVLGYPVVAGERRTLVLAMDRPSQAARAFRRIFTESEREALDERLLIWKGPPERDLAADPDLLTAMCKAADADTVIVDSLKDAAIGLSEDAVGAGWNRARQGALAAGVEVVELHHLVKRGANGEAPNSLPDVYGSSHLTNGAGSVFVLIGNPGDPIVALRHLKPIEEEVGPFRVVHDHKAGTSAIWHEHDLLTMATAGPVTARGAACVIYGRDKPTPSEVEKVRRRLEKLADSGQVERTDGVGTNPTIYTAMTS